jgi:branched-subunit amino acid aminotransferase/4-amino-4-deoxychorismate lyase
MEFYLHKGKITGHSDFNPREEWLNFPVKVKTSMWFAHGEIPFFDFHIRQANLCFDYMKRPYQIDFDGQNEMLRVCKRLINKNKAYMAGWLHLFLLLNDNTWEYLATVEKYPQREFPFDEQGKLAILSEEIKWSRSLADKSPVLMQDRWAQEKLKISGTKYGDTIFCNENGAVVETIGANLYYITHNQLITPSLSTGCIEDILRPLVLGSASETGLEVIESDKITPSDLQKADEIFTVSEQNGFKWIMGIGIKRFVRKRVEPIRAGVERLIWNDKPGKRKSP